MPTSVQSQTYDAVTAGQRKATIALPVSGELRCATLEANVSGTGPCYGTLEFNDAQQGFSITLAHGWVRGDTNGIAWSDGLRWYGVISLKPQCNLVATVRNDTGATQTFVVDYEVIA